MKTLLVLSLLSALLLFGAVSCSRKKSEPSLSSLFHYDYYVNDEAIRDVLKATEKKVYDRDGDGLVNCIDYTITFKKEWDKVAPPNQCEIVRNYDKDGRSKMNHLFVRVRLASDGEWLYVEPQADYKSRNYRMSDYWESMYDSKYNSFGETNYWLGECVQ